MINTALRHREVDSARKLKEEYLTRVCLTL